jgi:peptide chain release factor 1
MKVSPHYVSFIAVTAGIGFISWNDFEMIHSVTAFSSTVTCQFNSRTLPTTPKTTTTTTTTSTRAFRSSTSSSTALRMTLDSAMISRLEGIRRSYQALTERLGDPDVLDDNKLLQKVMSDRSSSEDVVNAYDEYSKLVTELEGARELFQEAGDDNDLREMARTEMKDIEPKLLVLAEQIKVLLLPKDPNDDRNVMLEIRAGTGGSEANIFAGDLLDVYRKYITSQGWQGTIVDWSPGDDGGYKNVVLEVKGDRVYSKLKWEAGVHRVQRVPATESQGRVHTSTATVAIMPECDEVDVNIDPKDIEMSTTRSGGAGGQVRAVSK